MDKTPRKMRRTEKKMNEETEVKHQQRLFFGYFRKNCPAHVNRPASQYK